MWWHKLSRYKHTLSSIRYISHFIRSRTILLLNLSPYVIHFFYNITKNICSFFINYKLTWCKPSWYCISSFRITWVVTCISSLSRILRYCRYWRYIRFRNIKLKRHFVPMSIFQDLFLKKLSIHFLRHHVAMTICLSILFKHYFPPDTCPPLSKLKLPLNNPPGSNTLP